ncbi:polysaccharide deacetylase family protein [Arthrobacter sp. ISL-85]|uniref:polysaccharide deacetylase family protein n=1 Tax=Arthrobacter sp. ISL-85 TaxID=2819115 RepID=UPI002034E115|nr:polysaccharide deacetylase family protein [Arthrobacter sp. ISL-85]
MSLTAVVGGRQVRASWTYLDGLPGLNSHVDAWLLATLDKAVAAASPYGGRYRPGMALNASPSQVPSLTVTAEPVLAGGTVVLFREKARDTGADGKITESSETFTVDTVSGEVRRAVELLRPEALDGIRSRVSGVPADIAAPAAKQPAPTDVVLGPAGELQVATVQGPSRRAGITTIPASDAEAMLNDAGRKVLAQLRSPAVTLPATAPALRHVNCDLVPCAALTYDDGPDAKTTPQLLTILQDQNAQATFFMTGANAAAHPATARQVADAGHAIGNHTYSHPYLTKLTPAAVKSEMDRTDAAIRAATGSSPPLMRPPYGAADAMVQAAVGKPLIIWAVDSLDWQSKNPALFVPKVLREITPGAVVLMHDVDPTTIAGQQELVTSLQTQGYQLVTVPQLFEGTPLLPGHVYRSRPERK